MMFDQISDVVFENIDFSDAHDFSDAFIVSACLDGEPMNDEQLEELNNDHNLVYDLLMDHIY